MISEEQSFGPKSTATYKITLATQVLLPQITAAEERILRKNIQATKAIYVDEWKNKFNNEQKMRTYRKSKSMFWRRTISQFERRKLTAFNDIIKNQCLQSSNWIKWAGTAAYGLSRSTAMSELWNSLSRRRIKVSVSSGSRLVWAVGGTFKLDFFLIPITL